MTDSRRVPTMTVVSYRGNHRWSPRGTRTERLVECLSEDWHVQLVAGPEVRYSTGPFRRQPRILLLLQRFSRWFLIDRFELWSWFKFRGWRPSTDAAILIGVPLSPLGRAQKKLTRRSIPYVLDLGDFSAIGTPEPAVHGIGWYRTERLERRLIREARGVVVTTSSQAQTVRAIAPAGPTLIRPNGYRHVDIDAIDWSRDDDTGELRILHLGSLSRVRVDIRPFLSALTGGDRWDRVTLVQLGDVKDNALSNLPPNVEVERSPAQPLEIAYAIAARCDFAIVVGNRHGIAMPSKAIQYLNLPKPRLAIVDSQLSELAQWVAGRPGWGTMEWNSDGVVCAVTALLDRGWSFADLGPPRAESWDAVAKEISAFATSSLRTATSDT